MLEQRVGSNPTTPTMLPEINGDDIKNWLKKGTRTGWWYSNDAWLIVRRHDLPFRLIYHEADDEEVVLPPNWEGKLGEPKDPRGYP